MKEGGIHSIEHGKHPNAQQRRESGRDSSREDASRVMCEQLLLEPPTSCLRYIRVHLSTF
eukprot:1354353-Pyramimonas_sp.AAC.1